MITIKGHTINEQAIDYIGPVEQECKKIFNEDAKYYVLIAVGGCLTDIRTDTEEEANQVRMELIEAVK